MKKKGLDMEQKRNLIGWAFLLPATILIFVFCFYPMVQALMLSFQKGMGSIKDIMRRPFSTREVTG